MVTTMGIMFLNDNTQLHVSILNQVEVEIIDQENNKHMQFVQQDERPYLEGLIVRHHLNINLKKHVIFI